MISRKGRVEGGHQGRLSLSFVKVKKEEGNSKV